MNLRYIERVNGITEKIVRVREEIRRREISGPPRNHGKWRHKFFIDTLKHKAEFLEKQRLALFGALPKLMKD